MATMSKFGATRTDYTMDTGPHLNKKDRHATRKLALRETAVPLARISRWNGSEVGRSRRSDGSCRGTREEVGLVLESLIRDRFRTKDGGPRPILGLAGRERRGPACGVRSALDSIRDRTHKSRVVFSTSTSPQVCASRAGLRRRRGECSAGLPSRNGQAPRLPKAWRGAPFRGPVGRSSRTSQSASSRDEDRPYGRLSSLFSSSFFAECPL